MQREHNYAIRIAVDEQQANGQFPITVTFESGTETYRFATGTETLDAVVAEFSPRPPVLYRGRARIQLDN